MTTSPPILTAGRFLDKSKNPLGVDNASISVSRLNDIIVAAQIDEDRGPWTVNYALRWRNVTTGGSFAFLAATGEIAWGTDTVLVNDNPPTQACTNVPVGSTWQVGKEVEGTWYSYQFTLNDEYYTELHFAINISDAQVGHQYQFELYDWSYSASIGVLIGYITIVSAPPTVVLNSPNDAATVGGNPTFNFTATDLEGDAVEYNFSLYTHYTYNDLIDYYPVLIGNTNLNISSTILSRAQSFTGDGSFLQSVSFFLYNSQLLTNNAIAHIYSHTGIYGTEGSLPGTLLYSSEPVSLSGIAGSPGTEVVFTFASPFQTEIGTHYFLTLTCDPQLTGTQVLGVRAHNLSPTHPGVMSVYMTSWISYAVVDLCFTVFPEEPILNKYSGIEDPGFTPGHPYASEIATEFTVQSGDALEDGTYYWRVRAVDPLGSNTYGAYSDLRSIIVEATLSYGGSGYQTSYKIGAVSQKCPTDGDGYQTAYHLGTALSIALIDVYGYGYQTNYSIGNAYQLWPVDGSGHQVVYGEGVATGPVLSYGLGYQTSYTGVGTVAQVQPVGSNGHQVSYTIGGVSQIQVIDGYGYQTGYAKSLAYVRYEELRNVEGRILPSKFGTIQWPHAHTTSFLCDEYGVLVAGEYGVVTFQDKCGIQLFEDRPETVFERNKNDVSIFDDVFAVIVDS